MAFLRIKNINGQDYAYVVENSWLKGSRQKVKAYLGRVYRFDIKNDKDFLSFIGISDIEGYIKNNEIKKIVVDLIQWEVFKHEIDKNEFNVDIENRKIQRKNKDICIKINDGIFCSKTLSNLLDFKVEVKEEGKENNREDIVGYKLAKAFVEAGINVPQEVFVGLFEKMIKQL